VPKVISYKRELELL